MVPSAFVRLDGMPLTPNGKLDKRRLPIPDALGLDLPSEYVPPRTPAEETMADIWARVLGRERVGVESDFFTIGGHSLLAMRVVSQVREAFRISLPVRTLFEAPTVASLVERIELLQWAAGMSGGPGPTVSSGTEG